MSSDYLIWQDREIRFDINKQEQQLQRGEILLQQQDHIEDSKGNEGETGTLMMTNLRIIWYQRSDRKINLSIGYDCILSLEVKSIYQQSVGTTQTLHIKGKFKQSRFEFIFRSMIGDSPKVFSSLQNVHKSYQSTKIYRDMKTRGGDLIKDKNVIILPQENIINKFNNISNVGSEQAQKGQLILTNVRIVWFATSNESFNISIPWILIKNITQKTLKSGPSIIIECLNSAGGYIVGYQTENMEDVVQKSQVLFKFYQQNPILGVELVENQVQKQPTSLIPKFEDDMEIVDVQYNQRVGQMRSYTTNQENGEDEKQNNKGKIIYSSELGLAIEKPQEGVTLDDLWKIIKITK